MSVLTEMLLVYRLIKINHFWLSVLNLNIIYLVQKSTSVPAFDHLVAQCTGKMIFPHGDMKHSRNVIGHVPNRYLKLDGF